MIVLAGRTYEATIGSDVQRDGMYLELADQHGHMVAQIFFSDFDRKMTVTLFESEASVEVVEWDDRHGQDPSSSNQSHPRLI
ncbi:MULTISPECIES: hypothetical protein [unclassified Mesorhizobium]|uniref:hypothetical protein n=1 Tax=unclassified Mesorhizobium TaxID=325217 RepID=UPI000FCB5B7D|nr:MULTISPECIES: hypothetical protein [unclassified Mesorhizobium]RUV99544.1 hypothetical protein EOA49_19395 [Mesorhizobium sp. M1A.F.Ca.IN.020.04.1.1]RUW08082.1 hypothetical protein EOA53_19615 [Mesorhizobium sp. M1A.F.Ca.IN.020.03.1.1]RWF70729.1 MAG: hypothetical protein EOQ34_17670 [Mesorhizobium sp.]RWG10614.1 MAG: hypothetical protein EOQ58_26405 [Mesorhizobium sp.]RWG26239.1 MAG: hypothetical protein EOQ61_26935 [Mesorhizobium sp.]